MAETMDFSLAEQFFGVSLKECAEAQFSLSGTELLTGEKMDDILRWSATTLQANDLSLPASFVGLAVFGICGALHTFAWQYNRVLDLSLANLVVHVKSQGGYPQIAFQIQELRWTELGEEGREAALTQAVEGLYREMITPLVEWVAERANVKPDVIWNQYGARLAYLKDYLLGRELPEDVRARFLRDIAWLEGELSPDLFNRTRNPYAFQPRYLDSPYQPDSKIMMRSSCCLYYNREGGEKCYNCPRLTEPERETMREKIVAAQQG